MAPSPTINMKMCVMKQARKKLSTTFKIPKTFIQFRAKKKFVAFVILLFFRRHMENIRNQINTGSKQGKKTDVINVKYFTIETANKNAKKLIVIFAKHFILFFIKVNMKKPKSLKILKKEIHKTFIILILARFMLK